MQNAERDYHRLREAEGLPIRAYSLYVPLMDPDTGTKTQWEWLPVLLPCEIIRILSEHEEMAALVGDASACLYWQEFLKQFDTAGHPIHGVIGDIGRSFIVPDLEILFRWDEIGSGRAIEPAWSRSKPPGELCLRFGSIVQTFWALALR